MRSQRCYHAITAIAALAVPLAATAGPPAPLSPVPGIFSDMKYQRGAGNVVGMEIFIIPSGEAGHLALVQCSDGSLTKPVLVQAHFKGSTVTLEPHTDPMGKCPGTTFVGTITNTELRGRFEGTERVWRLRRKSSVWQVEGVLTGKT